MGRKRKAEEVVGPPAIEYSDEDLRALREAYDGMQRCLAPFAADICGSVVTTDIPHFHHEIYRIVADEPRVVLAAPRGFAKSTIVARVYPLWLALFRHRRDICIISASESLAVEHLRWIKQELETNGDIIHLWGDVKSDKWSENHIIVRHPDGVRINIRAKGAGGQIRGFRPDCLILDDIETDESVESEEQRKKLKNWLFKACLNTLLPGGQLLVIGTPIHPLSVLCDLLEVPNGWFKKLYKAYKDGVQEVGHELWPEQRPHEWLQKRKSEIGSWAFASEFLCDPKLDEAAPIKENMIRYWKELPPQRNAVIAIDPAYSDDVKADYKVASLIGIDYLHNRYLEHYIRTHAPTGEFIDAVLNLYMRNKSIITAVGVPNVGVEKEFYRTIVAKASERHIYPPFVDLKNTYKTSSGASVRQKKERIIAALQGLFEQGKYFIHSDHIDARDEILTIGASRWDDIIDTMAYAEQILVPVYKEVEIRKKGRYGDLLASEKPQHAHDYGY